MTVKQEEYSFYYKVKNESARKRLGFKAGFHWCTAKKQSLALSRGELAMDAAGFDEADFAKPVRVNMPIENDLPPEGVFDIKFCENREIGADGKTLVLIPGVAASASTSDEKAEEVASATETDDTAATNTETDELPTYAYNVNGELMSDVEKDMTQSVSGKSFAVRFRANWKQPQCVTDVATWRLQEINAELMDPTGYIADIELALSDKEISSRMDKLEMRDVHCYARDIEKVFPENKRPGIQYVREFTKAWLDTDYIDRGLLVKEWQKGNRVSRIDKQETSDTPEPQKTSVTKADVAVSGEPATKTTYKTIDTRIGCALTKGEITYPIVARDVERGKAIVEADGEEFKRWSATYRITENIQFYDEKTHIEMIRQAPREVVTGSPELRRAYVDNYLAAYGTLDPDQMVFMPKRAPVEHEENMERVRKAGKNLRDMAAGRFQCDEEKPQPTGELANEPATPEAVEQDTTEHHPDPQPLENEPPVSQTEAGYQKIRAELHEARKNIPPKNPVDVGKQLAAARGEYVEGISDPNDPKWVKTETNQPTTEPELVKNVGNGIFDVSALMQNSSTHGTETNPEITSNVQVQEADSDEKQAGDAVQAGEGDLGTGKEAVTVENHNQAETHQNNDSVSQSEPEAQQNVPESQQEEPEAAWPEYFEPGRYEGVPNEVYHAANGISSTQVKDARVSLMYFNARHVEKTIVKERSPVLDMGNLVHALALQPENLEAEFSVEPEIPEGAFTTTATLREFIDAHNASLPALLSADDIKALLEEYNATLPSQMPLGASVDETYASYEQLPEEFQRIENGTKHTATAMKACIKEYNATLPAPVKTSGSRDALLEQLAIINPDLVAQEAQKSSPLKVSGTKADLIQAVKSVNPAAVFADELLDAWRENTEGKVLVTRQQLSTALNIQKALLEHPTAGKLLTHPSRAVEVSYFGIDEETGLEVRVRPDLEIDMGGLRIGADLKTISMWNIKQEGLRAKLHREIIDRDYHLSAAMYCETAALDQFFWIFVNKDENYHWVAIIEASTELLELGMLEYRKTMRAIANGFDTGEWPAPITEDYTDELNDFDVRRLEALRVQA
ncbi:TPA: DNA breaking-rejoining protein [Salmonella enterica subsp. enterica serovar Cremieu]|nr:DNA breaking-rejoining protein [Salmonella enterica subsp. enterica serovar Newport]EHM6206118.1 PD-(D/E)XK nuclease-like domain-containing protein [Salmonella enterica]HAU6721169.1 DNA breaking-rejoining protein [Salmonella enterica subsp. enterica serovar Cremieu]